MGQKFFNFFSKQYIALNCIFYCIHLISKVILSTTG